MFMKNFEIEDGVLIRYTGHDTVVRIPDSVTSIGDSAFSWCKALTNIEIPNSVTSIGDWAFGGCSSLEEINLNSVTSIGRYAFYGCTGLTNIIIGNNIKNIESRVFDACKIKHKPKDNIAYKGLNVDMTCRGFQYE